MNVKHTVVMIEKGSDPMREENTGALDPSSLHYSQQSLHPYYSGHGAIPKMTYPGCSG